MRLDGEHGLIIYERYVQIATLRAGRVLSFEELEFGWFLLPVQLASQRGEAPASLRSGLLPARDREEIRPRQNRLPAYDLSRVQLSMRQDFPWSNRYPESEVGISQRVVTHEHRRQERGGGNRSRGQRCPFGRGRLRWM